MDSLVHHSISDLYQTLGLPAEGETDFAILSIPKIHPQIPFESPVLQADYFSFILTLDGSGIYFLDDNRFEFGSGSIYFTNPGHKKSYTLLASGEAYIITLTEKFLRENVHPEIYAEFPFLLAEIVPPQNPDPEDLEAFSILYQQIAFEFSKNSRYKNKVIGHFLLVLLLKIKEKFWQSYNPRAEGSRDSQIVKTFKQLLESAFRRMLKGEEQAPKLQVQDLAAEMNLHPNYLNSVIKSKTGKTVNQWISRRSTAVAKSLLLNTTLSAKEIAYRMGYSEPTHFSRFFKKQTGMAPRTFRQKHRSANDL